MCRIAIVLNVSLFLIIGGLSCRERPVRRVPIDLTNLGQTGQTVVFSEVYDVSKLPSFVTTQLAGGFANPGDRFRETDVADQSLPLRRLVVAGVSERYVIVVYQVGVICTYFAVALFRRSNQEATLVSVSSSPRGTQLRQLKTQIESGGLRNELGHMIY